MTALCVASLPLAAYNASHRYMQATEVYDKLHSLYVKICNDTDNTEIGNVPVCADMSGETNLTAGPKLATLEEDVLSEARTTIRQAAGTDFSEKLEDRFLGKREAGCEFTDEFGDRCFGDQGIAMSVYEDAATKVIVFQAGFGPQDTDTIMWMYKTWLLTDFESALRHQWSLDAQQSITEAMAKRKAIAKHEMPVRCDFKDDKFKPIQDAEGVADAAEGSAEKIEEEGLWSLVKLLVRKILPEGQVFPQNIYLTGSGTGGTHAALASMWLKKNDDMAYDTYVIAAPGFQCLAHGKYSLRDMNPEDPHPQIHVFIHVMDALSGSMDRHSGTVCKYGRNDFTENETFYDACSKIVGHTGSELVWRPSFTTTTTTWKGATEENVSAMASYHRNISEAKQNFDFCHHWTHSPWYALMLLADETVLSIDGITDGGCKEVAEVPKGDEFGRCPDIQEVEDKCEKFAMTQAETPMAVFGAVMVSTGLVICCLGALGLAAVKKIQASALEDVGEDEGPAEPGFITNLLKKFGLDPGLGAVDRAKVARIRAKQARDKRRNAGMKEKKLKRSTKLKEKASAKAKGEKVMLLETEGGVEPSTVGRESEEDEDVEGGAGDDATNQARRASTKPQRKQENQGKEGEAEQKEPGVTQQESGTREHKDGEGKDDGERNDILPAENLGPAPQEASAHGLAAEDLALAAGDEDEEDDFNDLIGSKYGSVAEEKEKHAKKKRRDDKATE